MRLSAIDHPNISQSVAAVIREMIVLGDLRDGDAINEVHLAAKLAVSRTPLREALSALVGEQAVEHIPRRGFFVRGLTIEEATEIYAIRPLLEPEALRTAGLPSPSELDALDEINRQFAAAPSARIAIALDDEWHARLFSRTPNRTLIDILWHLIKRTHRYELGVMGQPEVLESSAKGHREIIEALRNRDLARGCDLLKQNVSGLDAVVNWLESRRR
jgi:DNA-binding GntR family transcriptional regulator